MLSRQYKTAAAVYLGQVGIALGLVAFGWFYPVYMDNSIPESSLTSLRIGVILIAVATVGLRRMLVRWDRLRSIALLEGIPGLLSSLRSNAIILGAMAEIIAVIGFLIAALGGIRTDILTFGAVALLLFLINFPRRSIWRKIVANLEKVGE